MELYVALTQMSTQWCGNLIILQYRLVCASCEFFGPRWCTSTWCESNIIRWAMRDPQLWIHFNSGEHNWFSVHGRVQKTWRSIWGCCRDSLDVWQTARKNNKQEKWDNMQSLAGTVRQQLMLRNPAILFMFFQHKQVLGSPGWEGHADKKKKEEPLFLCVHDLFRWIFFTDRLSSWNQHGCPSDTLWLSDKHTAYLKCLGYVACL